MPQTEPPEGTETAEIDDAKLELFARGILANAHALNEDDFVTGTIGVLRYLIEADRARFAEEMRETIAREFDPPGRGDPGFPEVAAQIRALPLTTGGSNG